MTQKITKARDALNEAKTYPCHCSDTCRQYTGCLCGKQIRIQEAEHEFWKVINDL